MSQAGSQAWAFYREVAKTRVLWTVKDEDGFPAPLTSEGKRSQPFWSSRSRVERIIASVPAYAGFTPHELSWSEFESEWVPELTRDGTLVGLNWSGPRASGFDIEAERVRRSVLVVISEGG
jgi:Protein of unknown function (DUF2750)